MSVYDRPLFMFCCAVASPSRIDFRSTSRLQMLITLSGGTSQGKLIMAYCLTAFNVIAVRAEFMRRAHGKHRENLRGRCSSSPLQPCTKISMAFSAHELIRFPVGSNR